MARGRQRAPEKGQEEDQTDAGEVIRRMLAMYEAGDLITSCAWCEQLQVDGEWVPAPRAGLSAIDSRLTLSHTICPQCTPVRRPTADAPRIGLR